MKIDEHRLKTYVAQGRKYLDALWDAIAEKKQPWDDGRIRLWLNPRLGRPPWLCGEIWAKYAADRKAAAALQLAGHAAPTGATEGKDSQKPAAPSHGPASHVKHDSGGKGKHR